MMSAYGKRTETLENVKVKIYVTFKITQHRCVRLKLLIVEYI